MEPLNSQQPIVINLKHATSLLRRLTNSFHLCGIKLCRVWRNCDDVCHTQWVGQQSKHCCWRLNEKVGQTTRLGHSEVEPSGTRGRFKMATFTTKAFCQTLALPSQCLSYTQAHSSIHGGLFLFSSTNSQSHKPSLCLWLCVFIIKTHTSLSSVLSRHMDRGLTAFTLLFSLMSLSLHLFFPLLRLFFVSVFHRCICKPMLYFIFLQLLFSILLSHHFLPVPSLFSLSLFRSLFLCLPVPACRCTARSLESAAKQRLFEKKMPSAFQQAV